MEFWLFEPFDRALLEGRMSAENYDEATGALRDVVWPAASAGRAVVMPDGTIATAPSWWDEADYERGIATPDAVLPLSDQDVARSALESAWGVLREDARAES